MKIVGFDVGCSTGWALCRDGVIVESGVQRFDLGRGESPGMRFLRFRRFLQEFMAEDWPDIIAFERPHLRGGYATELLIGFSTRLQEWAAERDIQTLPVHTATLKKWATGKGSAPKALMVARAERALGRAVSAEDEADAVLVALWAWCEAGEK